MAIRKIDNFYLLRDNLLIGLQITSSDTGKSLQHLYCFQNKNTYYLCIEKYHLLHQYYDTSELYLILQNSKMRSYKLTTIQPLEDLYLFLNQNNFTQQLDIRLESLNVHCLVAAKLDKSIIVNTYLKELNNLEDLIQIVSDYLH